MIVYMYFLLLNPFATIVYARSAFFSQSAVLILHFAPILRFTLSLHFTPSPQSVVCVLH